jgi:NAD(P)-dependent dehydrogenase (short-subunit alcohol dehydrogenase family)
VIDPAVASWGYSGRRAVVTGAASGIGQAVCETLVGLGAAVTAVDVQPVATEGVVASHMVDLADGDAIDATTEEIIETGGSVDALFNCAGIPGTAQPRAILAVNFVGLRRFTERLITSMSQGSAICSIGSTAAVNWQYHAPTLLELLDIDDDAQALDWLEGHLPDLGYPYDVSKEAVNAYTAWRANALSPLGVRINCVNPGGTFTPASREFTKAVRAKQGGAEMLEHWPTLNGRMAKPVEQAWPMVFLNSELASFVNGATLFVDAGLTAGLFSRQHHASVANGMFWKPPVPADTGYERRAST